ncbi:MAG: glycosyltransferase family 39 protein, partial [Candidatus Omnitrophica bacterium]|nr:glycosyltransferase family 39 protein [Candidatus Omnitrophota bacterium]
MNRLRSFFCREAQDLRGSERWTLWQIVAPGAIVLFAVIGPLWCAGDPYWLAFETGFQELIARRHIDPGLSMTHGLSTLNNLGPEATPHSTHPPLLQLTIAGLYSLFGESEAAARMIPAVSFWAMLWGIWRLTRGLSNHARVGALGAGAVLPLSFYVGRIVNFEAPTLACIVLTMVCVESLNRRRDARVWAGLIVLAIGGTLIDWPYPLFVMCLLLTHWLRIDRGNEYRKAVWAAWLSSMAAASLYVMVVYGAGVIQNMAQHAQLQTGAMNAETGFQWPPFLTRWEWWSLLFRRLMHYATPVFSLTGAVWLVWGCRTGAARRAAGHWALTLFVFCAAYIGGFSRASHNHLWTLFYVSPLLALAFGLAADRLKPWAAYGLLALAVVFAAPVIHDLR